MQQNKISLVTINISRSSRNLIVKSSIHDTVRSKKYEANVEKGKLTSIGEAQIRDAYIFSIMSNFRSCTK